MAYIIHCHCHSADRVKVRISRMKATIKQWNAVAIWQWNMPEDEVCGICRVQFDGTCPTCKYPGSECPLIKGTCQHAFHKHCVMKWLEVESSNGLCPMCRQKFEGVDDGE